VSKVGEGLSGKLKFRTTLRAAGSDTRGPREAGAALIEAPGNAIGEEPPAQCARTIESNE
jgi:hypothetical protein